MKQVNFLMTLMLITTLGFISCTKHDASTEENLTAVWNSTSVKIDGVAAPSTTKMVLHLQSSKQYEITTTITPFTHPKTGVWSVNSAGDKLTLSGNSWIIHHLDGSTMRIVSKVDGKELEIDFAK